MITTPVATHQVGRDQTMRNARVSGVFVLITFAASIPAAYYFLAPVLQDPNYILGSGENTRVAIGCLLDVIGAPLLLAATLAVAAGAIELGSPWFVGALPVAARELPIGLYLTVSRAERMRSC